MINRETMQAKGRAMVPSIEQPDCRMVEPGVWQISVLTVDDYRVAREGSRWRVTCDATGEPLASTPTLGLGIAEAEWHAKTSGRLMSTERPAVTRDESAPVEARLVNDIELGNFLFEWDISHYTPDTDAKTLLAHFEIRWRPEPLEAAESAPEATKLSSLPLSMSDWQRLHEAAQIVLRAREENRRHG